MWVWVVKTFCRSMSCALCSAKLLILEKSKQAVGYTPPQHTAMEYNLTLWEKARHPLPRKTPPRPWYTLVTRWTLRERMR